MAMAKTKGAKKSPTRPQTKPLAPPAAKAPAKAAPAPPPPPEAGTKRLNYSIAICGRKGTGKSTLLASLATNYIAGNAAANGGQGKRVLILDVNGSPAHAHLPRLSTDQLIAWKPGGSLKIATYRHEDRKFMMATVATHFRSGLLIMEDVLTYIGSNPNETTRRFLVDHRMADLDVLYTYHSLLYIPPFFYQFLAYIILLKTNDIEKKLHNATKIPNLPAVMAAYMAVNAHPSPYHNITIPTGI